ncbi:MAG: homoserine dehydrogenase [Verrucomicrobiae bacterium]|nr:homoserine dehydrogenase [Verrucomicrobiae bacterium]
MLKKLKNRTSNPIRVGLVGAGAMGKGIAWQVSHTPGMRLMFIGDLNLEVARETAKQIGKEPVETDGETIPETTEDQVLITTNSLALLKKNDQLKMEAFAEATNAIAHACEYCLAAIEGGMHVILMNAEVDIVYGKLLQHEAAKHKVIVTSDAGDQHGVLATMIDEIKLWGFDIVQAGNIKGFLNYYATPESIRPEAEKRNLSAVQCCAYTDGTKLNIEMALLCNALGLTPFKDGMEGPRCADAKEVLDLFDFDAYEGKGRVDYILGAEPGGGVYVVGHSDSDFQRPYLHYYKLLSKGNYYLFYRPYHLCHLETTTAIARAVLDGEAVLTPDAGYIADVYAYAKSDLKAGQKVEHGIGGAECYGLIRTTADASGINHLPISYLEGEGDQLPVIKRDIAKDEPVTFDDVEFPDIQFHHLLKRQSELG